MTKRATPRSENCTTLIHKVTAYVSKVPGTGFTNYCFNDLDYIDADNPGTGTYAYTQCNGADFEWLDEFDGKSCTVYITALNPKSTASGCNYRVLPISVEKIDNFTFDVTDGTNDIILYCNKSSQYSFLNDYVGKTVAIEFSLCDWNSKGLKGYVLAVITSDGKYVNSPNFPEN